MGKLRHREVKVTARESHTATPVQGQYLRPREPNTLVGLRDSRTVVLWTLIQDAGSSRDVAQGWRKVTFPGGGRC